MVTQPNPAFPQLSAAMLHDVPAKIPNPIKTALRRRGAKSVAFAPIQYFEYIALSEEESEDEGDQDFAVDEEEENQIEDEDEITVVEPLEPVARLKPTLTIDTKEKPKDREIGKFESTCSMHGA